MKGPKWRSGKRWWLLGGGLVLLVGVLLAADRPTAPPAVGAPAPDFSLETLDGGELSLSQFRGRPVLINFWASWCPPCLEETPDLERVYQTYKGEGFVILAVNQIYTESRADVEAFVDSYGVTFPILLDSRGRVTKLYHNAGLIPMSIFVNRQGLISHISHGPPMSGEAMEAQVAAIVK